MKFFAHVSIDHAIPVAGLDGFLQFLSVGIFSTALIMLLGYAKLSHNFVEGSQGSQGVERQ